MRALAYTRQSITEDDETLSLDSQYQALAAWAIEQGWSLLGEVRDANQKGWDDARPGLAEVMSRAARREYDVLLVWSIDRLARSVRIQENVIHDLGRHGVQVQSLRDRWADQPLFRQVLGAFAEEQTRVIAGHVRRAIAERSRRGLTHGPAPMGYARPAPDAALVVVEPAAEIIRGMFRAFAAGAGYTEIARDLRARGVPMANGGLGWTAASVRTTLAIRAYMGTARAGAVEVPNAHPAIVDQQTWDAVRKRERFGYYRRRTKPASWLDGRARHGCGMTLRLRCQSRVTGAGPVDYWFVYCPAKDLSRHRGTDSDCGVSPQIMALGKFEALAWSAMLSARDQVLSDAEIIAEAATTVVDDTRERERAEAVAALDRIAASRRRVDELYISGARDRDWFDATDRRLRSQEDDARAALAKLPVMQDTAARLHDAAVLRALLAEVGELAPEDRAGVLAELGVVVLDAGTRRQPHVWIEWRPWVRDVMGRSSAL